MPDVSNQIYEMVNKTYHSLIDKDKKMAAIYKRIRDGTATSREASTFAEAAGEHLAKAFSGITSDMLPDGKMYYNIAQSVVMPQCTENYEIVSEAITEIQDIVNKRCGLSLNARAAKMDEDNIKSIIDKIVTYDSFDDAKWLLDEPMVNFSMSIVDRSIAENADFQLKSGIRAVIERVALSDCCDWCQDVAGVYDYSDLDKGDDVFRRHNACRCLVLYRSAEVTQNVHSKVDYADHKQAMTAWQRQVESRKATTPSQRIANAEARRKRR